MRMTMDFCVPSWWLDLFLFSADVPIQSAAVCQLRQRPRLCEWIDVSQIVLVTSSLHNANGTPWYLSLPMLPETVGLLIMCWSKNKKRQPIFDWYNHENRWIPVSAFITAPVHLIVLASSFFRWWSSKRNRHPSASHDPSQITRAFYSWQDEHFPVFRQ